MIYQLNNIHLILLVLSGLIGPFSATAQATVSGTVHTLEEYPICEVIVSLLDENGQTIAQDLTTIEGIFSFADVPLNGSYSLHLDKDDPLNGISAFDQVLMMRSILGLDPLDPYQSLAADVDHSGSVSMLDIIHIRRLILVITEELPGQPWLFGVAADLPDGSNLISLGELTGNLDLDILGLKTADVNYSAETCY